MTNKTRCVKLGHCLYQLELTIISVPQGSDLGPLFLALYINDLTLCCEQLDPYTFADDTNLHYDVMLVNFYAFKNKFNQIATWFAENKLCMHSSKTQLINFSDISLDLTQSSKTLYKSGFVKYLRPFLDREIKIKLSRQIKKLLKRFCFNFLFLSD